MAENDEENEVMKLILWIFQFYLKMRGNDFERKWRKGQENGEEEDVRQAMVAVVGWERRELGWFWVGGGGGVFSNLKIPQKGPKAQTQPLQTFVKLWLINKKFQRSKIISNTKYRI